MNEKDLIKYNFLGLIPGPEETEEVFKKRVDFCLKLKEKLEGELTSYKALALSDEEEKQIIGEALNTLTPLYGLSPLWIPLFFSNWRLMPWHGASAWIFQSEEEGPWGTCIQLRKSLYYKNLYLSLYRREELIAHEFCHAGRMAFEEKQYEELLAYRTSRRKLIQYFGPLIQSASESRGFILILLILLLIDSYFLMNGEIEIYRNLMFLKLIPLGLISWAGIRLGKRQQIIKHVLKKLLLLTKEHANALLYRLTDREINQFASLTVQEIVGYALKEPSLRWKVIRLSYLYNLNKDFIA